MPSTAFCSLLYWNAKCRWEESAARAPSQEKLTLISKHLYEYQNTRGTVEDERMRGGVGGRERQSSYVARKPVFSSPSSSLTKQRATRVDTFVLPLYSPLGYLFWEGTMHNKGSVLHPLTGWDADTPQLIMCLSVAVWAAANGIKSSIFEQCSAHSRMQCCTSQISTVF